MYFGHDGKGKLVRDNLPQVIASQGYPVKYHQLNGANLAKSIAGKMPEEAYEVIDALKAGDIEELAEEIGDLQELIDCLLKASGITKEHVDEIRNKKASRRGSFTDGQYIEYVDLVQDAENLDYWDNYFTSRPDGYVVKEVKDWLTILSKATRLATRSQVANGLILK